MVKIDKIFTRTGDQGTTGLIDGSRVSKDHLRVAAYGTIDELNCIVGWARTIAIDDQLGEEAERLGLIQQELFDLGAELAAPGSIERASLPHIKSDSTERLEGWITSYTDEIEPLRSFVLPGGTILNSALHICRATTRRAEREVVTLQNTEVVAEDALKYLNRLSDLFFAMARFVVRDLKDREFLWQPKR